MNHGGRGSGNTATDMSPAGGCEDRGEGTAGPREAPAPGKCGSSPGERSSSPRGGGERRASPGKNLLLLLAVCLLVSPACFPFTINKSPPESLRALHASDTEAAQRDKNLRFFPSVSSSYLPSFPHPIFNKIPTQHQTHIKKLPFSHIHREKKSGDRSSRQNPLPGLTCCFHSLGSYPDLNPQSPLVLLSLLVYPLSY